MGGPNNPGGHAVTGSGQQTGVNYLEVIAEELTKLRLAVEAIANKLTK
jgi:hypothetical protein